MTGFLGPVEKVIGTGVNVAIGAAGMIEDNVNLLKNIKAEEKRQEESKKEYDNYIRDYNNETKRLKQNEIDPYMSTLTPQQIESVRRSQLRKAQGQK
jgi:esterase/lipase